ncbi:unnamed protein product [Mytilus coruscus]|uniref:Uncharacterized protein n=1 Tax=Mytilus coruscus TaxID=42192 RepID=A0A6J8CM17_MYTCO|nr:unnamed protein product [Mytilus coruscus]
MDFTCAHDGKNDCRRHVQSKSHLELQKSKASKKSFCKNSETEIDRSRLVTRAEAMQCQLIANMNLSLSSADTMNTTLKVMFPDSKIAADENIFLLIDKELTNKHIPSTNNLALRCDNASTMTGKHKGVIAFARRKHPDIFLAGCTLHLVHIAAKKKQQMFFPQFMKL